MKIRNDIKLCMAVSLFLVSVFLLGYDREADAAQGAVAGADQLVGQEEGKAQKSAEPASPDLVNQKVLAFNLEGLTEKGEKKWDVSGESAESVTEDRIKLNNVTAKSYGQDTEATIKGDIGIYDKSKNDVTLEKNVRATIENSQGFAGDMVGLPAGAAANQAASGQQDAAAGKPARKKTVITCDGDAHFDYKNNEAYFDKNVKVVSADGNIDADRITVYLDVATKKVKEIVAEGNVRITRGENVTYSDKATYLEAEKKIVLTGQPKLVIVQEGEIKDGIPNMGAIGDTGKK